MTDSRHIELIDVTIRDAHQSLWATRMTTQMIAPIAPVMDRAGFSVIDIMGGAGFDVCVRFLGEDPWWRMDVLRELLPTTPINVWLRGQSLFTFELFPDDVVEATIRRLAAHGIDRVTTFDPLNDLRNVDLSIRVAREIGLHVTGGLAFTHSPVHTDALYVEKARQLLAMGIDELVVKDATGVLTPERSAALLAALKVELPAQMPLQLHSHCRSGLAPQSYLAAITSGATTLHTACRPLANGASLPASEFVTRHARRMGFETSVDDSALKAMAEYFEALARRHGKPCGEVAEYDPEIFNHQVPGGMISNLENQLQELGVANRFDEILDEVAQVREDLGYPVVVSPFAQFVVTQATLNVVQGERYKTVPDELKKYAQGYYGTPAGSLAPEFLERALGGREPVSDRAGEYLPPGMEQVRQRCRAGTSDEDLLLSVFYSPPILDNLFAQRDSTARTFAESQHANVLFFLADGLARRKEITYAELGAGTTRLRLGR